MFTKYLSWFSAGAASAVATKLAISEHDDVSVFYTDTGSEHPDNQRFIRDCQEWFGQPVNVLRSEKYSSTWDVFEKTKFLVGPTGARCTIELKKKVRWSVEKNYDVQIFGYTADRRDSMRADRFRQINPDVRLCTPLIERGLTKKDCLGIIDRAGIEVPVMYQLGYENNNCIGCVKGGAGYWNKIRRDFPEVFERMAKLERDLGRTILKDDAILGTRLYLDELSPTRGRYKDEPNIECSLLCTAISDEIGDEDNPEA